MTLENPDPWQRLSTHPHELGEGIRLDGDTVRWVDLQRGEIFAWSLQDDAPAVLTHRLDAPIGMVERSGSDTLLGIVDTGVAEIREDGTYELLATTGLDSARHRINDGTVGPDGSLWFGTMVQDDSTPEGAVWRWDPHTGETALVMADIDIPNGPVFDSFGTLLIADTARGRILRTSAHAPADSDLFATVDEGSPDGMHVDQHGRIWSAVWGARRIDVYGPDGERLTSVPVPVEQPTSVVITAPADPLLILTSANIGLADPLQLDGHTIAARLSSLHSGI